MELKEVKAFFEANKDNAEVKSYLSELGKPSKEALVDFAGKPEGLEALQSVFDRERTKAISGFKEKGMQSLLDEERKKVAEETEKKLKKEYKIDEDPAMKRIRELEEKLATEQNEKKREKIMAQIREKLPEEMRDILAARLVDADEDRTRIVTEDFIKALDAYGKKVVEGKVKGGQYTPGKGQGGDGGGIKHYTPEEIAQISKDPAQYAQHRDAIQKQLTGGRT